MLKKILCIAILFIGLHAEELDIRIPVVDMQDFYNPEKKEEFLQTLFDAMTEIGFFAVRNTGVDGAVVKNAYAEAETFFRKDLDFKSLVGKKRNGQRGFVPGEIAKGNNAKDFKEFYHIGREVSPEDQEKYGIAPNVWPEQEGFKEAMMTLYNELDKYVVPLQEAIIASINRKANKKIPLDYLNQMTKHGDTLLRALYYPALTPEQMTHMDRPLFWAAAHTDIDILAILPFATERGLQVEYKGQWLNVVVPSDAFVVNLGDMIRNQFNDLVVSAKHRVLAQDPYKDRFSMVLFVHPRGDAPLDPLETCIELTGGVQKCASGTRNEFLWERLLELNIATHVLEPYAKSGHTERQMKYGKESPQVVKMLVEKGLASKELLEALEKKTNQ